MNSKDLVKRGFSEPVDFVEGGEETVPRKIGIYIIFRKDKEIDYGMGKSDIVKIGKCVEEGKGFRGKYQQQFNPGPTDTKNLRIRPMFKSSPHAFAWLELPKEQAKAAEKRLLNEFVRFHGQYPPFNLTH